MPHLMRARGRAPAGGKSRGIAIAAMIITSALIQKAAVWNPRVGFACEWRPRRHAVTSGWEAVHAEFVSVMTMRALVFRGVISPEVGVGMVPCSRMYALDPSCAAVAWRWL